MEPFFSVVKKYFQNVWTDKPYVCSCLRIKLNVCVLVCVCVYQHIRGRAWPPAERHWGEKYDKSQPDLQLPQEQDVQKDQGEGTFVIILNKMWQALKGVFTVFHCTLFNVSQIRAFMCIVCLVRIQLPFIETFTFHLQPAFQPLSAPQLYVCTQSHIELSCASLCVWPQNCSSWTVKGLFVLL